MFRSLLRKVITTLSTSAPRSRKPERRVSYRPRADLLEDRTLLAINWTNAAGGSWHTPANWDLARVPAIADEVVIQDFGDGANVTVVHDTGTTVVDELTSGEHFLLAGGSFSVGAGIARVATLNGNFTHADGTLALELGTPAVSDRMNVSGNVTLRGALSLSALGAFTPSAGQSFTIIENGGTDAVVGAFSGLAEGASVGLAGLRISYVGGDGNDVVLTVPGGTAPPPTGSPTAVIVRGLTPATSSSVELSVNVTNLGPTGSITWTITGASPVSDPNPAIIGFDPTAAGGTFLVTVTVDNGTDTVEDTAEVFVGTDGDDTPALASPTANRLLVFGLLGADTIEALNVDDVVIDGGDGADTITAAGDDITLFGGDGNDILTGEGGRGQVIYGDEGLDNLVVTAGEDITLFGGDHNDTLSVQGPRSVTLFGDEGNDTITTVHGEDITLFGGGGDDRLLSEGGDRVSLFGGGGTDQVDTTAPPAPIPSLNEAGELTEFVATSYGGPANQVTIAIVAGSTLGATFIGLTVTVTLASGSTLGEVAAEINGAGGPVQVAVAAGLNENSNASEETGGVPLSSAGEDLTLFGGDGNDTLSSGTAPGVVIYGGDGDDVLAAEDDDVTLFGGGGLDNLTAGSGGNRIAIYGDEDNDSLSIAGTGDDITLFGGVGNDTLTASNATGQDITLFGGEGDDVLTVSGAPGSNKVLSGDEGHDNLTATTGEDVTLLGGSGNDTLTAGAGKDSLSGGADNDILDGGQGNDTMLGGDGDDYYIEVPGSDDVIDESGTTGFDTIDLSGANYALIGFDKNITGVPQYDTQGNSVVLYGGFEAEILPSAALTPTITGDTDGVRGQERSLTLTAPGASGTVTFTIDWGDGTPIENVSVASGTLPLVVHHVYTYEKRTAGAIVPFLVQVTADDSTHVPGAATHQITITPWAVQTIGGEQVLVVGGTVGDDGIHLREGASGDWIKIRINERDDDVRLRGRVGGDVDRIIVYGQAGDDRIEVAGSICVTAELHGGAGNDRLKGGGGNDILLGGEGDDLLIGGAGRDVLIGGMGEDRLHGNADDDVLIAGHTAHDGNADALRAILAEWCSGLDYTARVNHIASVTPGGQNGTYCFNDATVWDDGARDVLTGDGGRDWFILNVDANGGSIDRATDVHCNEVVTDIDIWLA